MSASTRWAMGAHHGLVWDRGIALVDASLGEAVAEVLWNLLRSDTDLAGFFTALSEASGQGLLDLPGFAVVVRSSTGHCQMAARGDFEASATVGTDTRTVSGAGVTTWSEARVHAASEFAVFDLSAAPETVERLIVAGIVPACALRVGSELPGRSAPDDPPVSDDAFSAVPDEGSELEPADEHRGGEPADVELGAEPAAEPLADHEEMDSEPDEEEPDEDVSGAEPAASEDPEAEPDAAEPVEEALHDADDDAAAADPPAESQDPEFGHLWAEHTSMEPVENAAVRASDGNAPVVAPPPTEVLASPRSDVTRIQPGMELEPEAEPEAEPDPELHRDPARAGSSDLGGRVPASPLPDDADGLISSVPKPSPVTPATPAGPSVAPPAGAPESADDRGDHDGHTVMQLPDEAAADLPAVAAAVEAGSTVLAISCPSGHANPPQRPTCRVCGTAVDGSPRRIPRPSLGQLVTSAGEVVELVGPVVVGRDPRAARFQGTEIPRLLPLPHAHVSANHLEIRIEGWSVLAVDMHSTNGTFLRRHGEPPVRLPESAQLLVTDDVLDLGHGVHLTFQELP